MNINKTTFVFALIFFFISCKQKSVNAPRLQKIDFDWQFHLGDIENGESPQINTSNWRMLDVPHDWSIEGEYSMNNGTDWQMGFLPAGIGWYRKNLPWNPLWKDKKVKIHFDGVYLNSTVWINGHLLGHRPNGYLGFEYDLTNYLNKGNNVIAVKVDQSKPLTARWYTGSGIYRHVWLKVQNPVHFENQGIFFTTPHISKTNSDFVVNVSVQNEKSKDEKLNVVISLLDKNGSEVAREQKEITFLSGETTVVNLNGKVKNPQLWSPDNPYLYYLKTTVYGNNHLLDENEMKVGFRNLEFNPEEGFKLNGKVTKLKGVCDHHTAGALGSAVPDDVLLYRLKLLKEMGCNAIRTAHNPFSPDFYNICDSLGLMVLNEFLDGWNVPKAPDDYGNYFEKWWKTDGTDFIKRDRNHPSVIIWSIGNEVRKATLETQAELIALFHSNDPTRPVTQGGNDPTRGMKGDNNPTQLDLKGFNGDGEERGVLERHHALQPDEIIVGTEIPHTYQTRGVYRTKTQWRLRDFPAKWEIKSGRAGKMGSLKNRIFPIPDLTAKEVFTEEKETKYYQNGNYYPIDNNAPWGEELYYQSSYDNATVRAGARKTWQHINSLPYVIGSFRWGSFDYLGETNGWPSRFGNFGVIDICGFPKDHFYLYQSLWTQKPMVHILPHWTHPGKEGIKIPVVAYTNCDEVELFLNGKSLGNKKYKGEQLVWLVPYQPGTIKAVARKEGKVVAEDIQTTAGKVAKIKLQPNRKTIRANRTDVVMVTVDITDKDNNLCPFAQNVVTFNVSGPAKIIGVDNGDPLDLSNYKTNVRKAFRGKLILLLQSTGAPGEIDVNAVSGQLEEGQIKIFSES